MSPVERGAGFFKCHPNSVLQLVKDRVAQITGIISNSSSLDENRLYNSHQESYLYIHRTNFPFRIIFFFYRSRNSHILHSLQTLFDFSFRSRLPLLGNNDSLPLRSSHSSDMRSINSGKCSSQESSIARV